MKKIISYIYISLFAITSLCAQQKIDPTLEVNRDFDGKLLEIHKTKLNTTFDDSLSRFNLDFNYSIFNKPYRDMYEFNPLPSLQLEKATFAEFTKLYVKASAGYPFNPKGEIYYQPKIDKRDNPKNTLVFWGKLDAFIGDIKLDNYNSTNNSYTLSDIKVKANNSKWDIGTYYNHNWENGILYSKLSYGGFRNSFYGANALTNSDFSYDYRTVNSVKANFGVSSIDATAKGSKFNYNFEFDYLYAFDSFSLNRKMLVKDISNINENLINIKGSFGPTVGKYNKFLVDFESNTALYNDNSHGGLFRITPMYKFENGKFVLNVGVNISFAYSNMDKSNQYHNIFMPNVNFTMGLIKDYLWFYASAEGKNYLNDYYNSILKNKAILPYGNLKTSSIPFVIKGGFKGKGSDKFSYDINMGYQRNSGMIQFITDDSGKFFYPAYSSNNQLFVSGALYFNSKDFKGGANIKYSSYSKGKDASGIPNGYLPIGYSPLEGYIFAEYNYMERIFAGINLDFQGKSEQYIYSSLSTTNNFKMNGFANLSINLKYCLSTSTSIFIEGGNLLNQRVQHCPFYADLGINISAGIALKF